MKKRRRGVVLNTGRLSEYFSAGKKGITNAAALSSALNDFLRNDGPDRSTVYGWLKGQRCSQQNLDILANFYDVDPDELIRKAVLDSYADQRNQLMAAAREGFVGRDFVFAAIRESQEKLAGMETGGYFLLKGKPGDGKSAILAEYVQRLANEGQDHVVHFNHFAGATRFPVQFFETLSAQLQNRDGTENDGTFAITDHPNDYSSQLTNWLNHVTTDGDSTRPLTVVLDALDEVDIESHLPGVNVLYLPDALPKCVHVVASVRSDFDLRLGADRVTPFDLREFPQECRKDVADYVREFLKLHLSDQLAAAHVKLDTAVEQICDRSRNNFMYLRHILPCLLQGEFSLTRMEQELPAGLSNYYDSHRERMGLQKHDDPDYDLKLTVVYLLAESDSMLTSSELLTMTRRIHSEHIKAAGMGQLIKSWSPFLRTTKLDDGSTAYSIYHKSFSDYLMDTPVMEFFGIDARKILDGYSEGLDEFLAAGE